MADKRWKAFERRVAKAFGTERTPLSGGNSKMTRSDTLHPTLYIECKSRVSHRVLRGWQEHVAEGRRWNADLVPVFLLVPHGGETLALWHSASAGQPVTPVTPFTCFLQVRYMRLGDSLMSLLTGTVQKAWVENKVPVVCVGQKGRPGFWLLCRKRDALEVSNAL